MIRAFNLGRHRLVAHIPVALSTVALLSACAYVVFAQYFPVPGATAIREWMWAVQSNPRPRKTGISGPTAPLIVGIVALVSTWFLLKAVQFADREAESTVPDPEQNS